MNRSNHLLNDLVSMARDGMCFYEHAATQVAEPALKSLFLRIANLKGEIVAGLSSELRAAGGDRPTLPDILVIEISKLYEDLRGRGGRLDFVYIARLEGSEDRLLLAFEDARSDPGIAPSALAVLNRLAPEVRQCHELVRYRKQALKQAA
jgi:uncharacterized protein (TIGR02284 family)